MEGQCLFKNMRRIRMMGCFGCSFEVIEQNRTIVRMGTVIDDFESALTRSLAEKLAYRAAGRLQVEAIVFSNQHGLLGQTPGAAALAAYHEREGESA